jgi:type II secretory pathway pseudopilin PulG
MAALTRISRLRSNSILEVLVALVIITIIFGIATTIFIRVTLSSRSETKMSAEQLLKEYAENTERNQLLFNERVIRGTFRIERISTPSGDNHNLWQIRYTIYDIKDSLLSAFNSFVIGE